MSERASSSSDPYWGSPFVSFRPSTCPCLCSRPTRMSWWSSTGGSWHYGSATCSSRYRPCPCCPGDLGVQGAQLSSRELLLCFESKNMENKIKSAVHAMFLLEMVQECGVGIFPLPSWQQSHSWDLLV